jgi:hypothetical protein
VGTELRAPRIRAGAALQVVALLLLGAHLYRAGLYPLVGLVVALLGLPFVERPWARWTLRVVLVCAAAEWARTAWMLAGLRASMDRSYARLVLILGGVAALTLAAALVRPQPSAAAKATRD